MNRIRAGLLILGIVFLLGVGWVLFRPQPSEVKAVYSGITEIDSRFSRVTGPVQLYFPRDFGAHPDYQTEWWYFTGNLTSQDGRRYGYELTFFRRAIQGPDQIPQRNSSWGTSQVYLAHFTLSDVSENTFQAYERIDRGAAGLAGVAVNPLFHVWLHDWAVTQTAENSFHLAAKEGKVELSLDLQDLKGPVLQGDHGYSQKGPEAGNASIYVSLTRLETTGTIWIQGAPARISGLSWMDHEFGTDALGPGQTGWDWFSIQLDDGSELMVYQIRDSDGKIDPYSKGLIVSSTKETTQLNSQEFQIIPTGSWKSQRSGAIYPSAWRVIIPSRQVDLEIRPLVADQELNLSFVYWEGAVQIDGTVSGKAVHGKGYVEMTGYARSMAGQF